MNQQNISNQIPSQVNNPLNNIEQKLNLLQSENVSLKAQLQSFSEKEKLYHLNLEKIKSIQSEQEKNFFNSIKDSKKREEELKQKFLDFQKLLENQYSASEARFNEEMNQMSQEISKRDNVINSLKNELNEMEEKIAQEELNFGLKEKEFENVIKIKERKLEELNEAVKQITDEATQEIKRMSEQLEEFQMKSKNNNNINNNNYNINNNANNKYSNDLKNENLRLKIENNSLRAELDKRNKELNFWKNKKNIPNIKTNTKSDALKELEINQLKRTLNNYGNKIKLISDQYKNFVMRHQREKKNLLDQINNLKKIKHKNIINPNRFSNKLNKYRNYNTEINNNTNEYNHTDIYRFNNDDYISEPNNIRQLSDNFNQQENDINIMDYPDELNLENNNNLNENLNINELNQINNNQINLPQNINQIPGNEVESDIKELDDSDDENMNEAYKYVEDMGEINDNINNVNNFNNFNNNTALINRMQNNIPSVEAKRNEFINNQLKNMPKSDYEE